ncbi:MAG TPA: pilus assembly protein PilM [Phycisphaerae bacterium]|nr:pilus assembly protein PilM [Phycisphaerae bacterium]
MSVGSKVLGLAVGQKSILVAEVQHKGDRHLVSKYGEFVFPEGISLSQPEKLGQAFRDFLRGKGFSTRDAVIGLPAKRLVTRRKEIPAASPAIAASTLRLQAEGEFSSELDNLIMDFAGTPSATEPTSVLLIATKKVVVDECELMAQTAGLKVHAVTSTTVALGRATSRLPGGDGLVLDLGSSGAELVIQHGTDPAHIRHLNVAPTGDALGLLAGEIRRTMASIPRNGTPQTLAVWNTGSSENPESILEQRLSIPVTSPGLDKLVSTDGSDARAYVPAIAVALMAMESSGPAIDFLHSRLAPPKEPAMSPQKKLAYAGALLLTVLVALGYKDLSDKDAELKSLQAQNALKKNVDAVTNAKAEIRRYEDAVNWMPKGPTYIAVMTDLTDLFMRVNPNTSRGSVWVKELNYTGNNTWELKGECTDQSLAQQLRIKMLDNANYADGLPKRFDKPGLPNVAVIPPARGETTSTVTFTLTFTYVPATTATAAATKPVTAATRSTPASRPASAATSSQPAK